MTMLPFANALFGKGTGAGSLPPRRPTLEFRYDVSQYWLGDQLYPSLGAVPGVSFARTGEQGVVTSAGIVSWLAADVAAINDRGFHAYGALTNLLRRSSETGVSPWVLSGTTVVADSLSAPDGAMAMDKIVETTGAGFHGDHQVITFPQLGPFTFSRVIKAAGRTKVRILVQDATLGGGTLVEFNLVSGTIHSGPSSYGSGAQPIGASIVPLGGGLFRCVLIVDAASVSNLQFIYLRTLNETNAQNYVGDGASGVHAWQAQMIAGSFADGGPCIRTGGTTAAIGASQLTQAIANGRYTATYTFDDGSEQSLPVIVDDERFRHATSDSLSREIVRRVSVVAD